MASFYTTVYNPFYATNRPNQVIFDLGGFEM